MRTTIVVSWFIVYFLALVAYAVFSYVLTDPNLVLSQWEPYWQFQTWMWQELLPNKTLLVWLYLIIIVTAFVAYLNLYAQLRRHSHEQWYWWRHGLMYALLLFPLLISYNALSHDVFNYLFNAKMVVVYADNPHQSVALSYPDDDWTRFMHNTHTAAPYGYGWTALSLLPFIAGQQIFIVTWLLFRLFAVLSVVLLYAGLQFLSQQITGRKRRIHEMALLFLNPLLLIEIVGNMHNDLWMLVPAVFGIGLFWKSLAQPQIKWLLLFAALLLIAVSISIKYVTILWLPLLLGIVVQQRIIYAVIRSKTALIPIQSFRSFADQIAQRVINWLQQFVVWIPASASFLTFLPLLSSRSQYFHPWYLTWSLIWVPFMRLTIWTKLLIVFSFSSLLRYLPWLYYGGYGDQVLLYQQLMTWVLPVLFLLWAMSRSLQSMRQSRVWGWLRRGQTS